MAQRVPASSHSMHFEAAAALPKTPDLRLTHPRERPGTYLIEGTMDYFLPPRAAPPSGARGSARKGGGQDPTVLTIKRPPPLAREAMTPAQKTAHTRVLLLQGVVWPGAQPVGGGSTAWAGRVG